VGNTLLVLLNAHHEPIDFTLPARRPDVRWSPLFDTGRPRGPEGPAPIDGGAAYRLEGRSLAVFLRDVQPGRAAT
jgi:glycogen operon protein